MSRTLIAILVTLVVAFGSGVAVGLYVGGGEPGTSSITKTMTSSSTSSSTAEGPGDVHANTLLSDRIRELEKELAEQKQAKGTITTDRLAFFKKYLHHIRVNAFKDDLGVTPEMVEILGLSQQEQEAIEQHLGDASQKMKEYVKANTVLTKQSATDVSFEVTPNPQGKELREQLKNLLAGDVGEDRAEYFMGNGNFDYYGPFDGFAQEKQTIEVAMTQANVNGHTIYSVTRSSEHGSMSSSSAVLDPQYQKYFPNAPIQ